MDGQRDRTFGLRHARDPGNRRRRATYVRERSPDITRVLLTGQADVDSAVAAINHGQVFRFLTKPCAPQSFLAAVRDSVEQNRLVTAERVLLEQTLRGSIAALAEVLSLSRPLSFGRSVRIKNHAVEIAKAATVPMSWQLDVAATLSQIGCVTLPESTCEKLYYGRPLDSDEAKLAERLPQIGIQLIEHIPRLEGVRSLVEHQNRNYDGAGGGPIGDAIPLGARVRTSAKVAQHGRGAGARAAPGAGKSGVVAKAEEDADLAYLLENAPSAVERALDGLSRVATIVRSMKEFAHPDLGEATLVDLNHAVQNTLTMARNEYKYVADLKVDLGTLPMVRCYIGELNQTILSIVVNAAHAIGDVVNQSGNPT